MWLRLFEYLNFEINHSARTIEEHTRQFGKKKIKYALENAHEELKGLSKLKGVASMDDGL